LLDYRFIAFAQKIPTEYKVDILKTKKLMRDMVKDIVPKEILVLQKRGFTPPFQEYVLSMKGIRSILKKVVNSTVLPDQIKQKISFELSQDNFMNKSVVINTYLYYLWYRRWIKNI
jgi:asparagine synthase (glutamine-hydrolysing)